MADHTIQGGLIVSKDNPKQCAGYIFNFADHGAFDPAGHLTIDGSPATEEQIRAHNEILGKAELEHYKKIGQGVFYLTRKEDEHKVRRFYVSTWAGPWEVKTSFVKEWKARAFGRSIQAYTAYFTGPDGKRWYGINKGDSQILRARRLKNQ